MLIVKEGNEDDIEAIAIIDGPVPDDAIEQEIGNLPHPNGAPQDILDPPARRSSETSKEMVESKDSRIFHTEVVNEHGSVNPKDLGDSNGEYSTEYGSSREVAKETRGILRIRNVSRRFLKKLAVISVISFCAATVALSIWLSRSSSAGEAQTNFFAPSSSAQVERKEYPTLKPYTNGQYMTLNPVQSPSLSPSKSRLVELVDILLQPPFTNFSSLTEFSPQYQALEWLLYDDHARSQLGSPAELQERFALVTLYFSTRGKQWKQNALWLSSSKNSHCNWYGVSCDSSNLVTALNLADNRLLGKIPVELGKLNQVVEIHMESNLLSGSLPGQLGALSKLTSLNLFSNNLTGVIPRDIGKLGRLLELTLWKNELRGQIPTEIGGLTILSALDIADNQINGTIPSEIGLMHSLQKLYLERNNIHGQIPTTMGMLTTLEILYLRNNRFSKLVPDELNRLTNLLDITLDQNKFSGGFETLLCDHHRQLVGFYADCRESDLSCFCCTHCCLSSGGCIESTSPPSSSPSTL